MKDRIDCHPDPSAYEEKCQERGCVWEPVEEDGPPWCYYPPDYGYLMVGDPVVTQDGFLVHLARTTEDAMFGEEAPSLWVQVELQKTYRLRIKITDDKPRYQIYSLKFF